MMAIEKIKSEFIESLLKNWRKGNFSEESIALFAFWTTEQQSLEQKKISLRDYLFELVHNKLPTTFIEALGTKDVETILASLKSISKNGVSNQQIFAILYCRYLNTRKYSVKELSSTIGVSERTLRRYVFTGFERLTLEIKQNINEREEGLNPTELDTDQLIGVSPSLKKLSSLIITQSTPYLLSIEGIGGIGKTALAQLLKAHFEKTEHFEEVVWVSARQNEVSLNNTLTLDQGFTSTFDDVITRLSREMGQTHLAGRSTQDKLNVLKNITRQKKSLIFIDNLETIEDIKHLIPALLGLSRPSKVVVTSRKSLSQYEKVQTFPIPELSHQDSQLLIKIELERRGKKLSVDEKTLTSLYEVTGGIPLALKLASAQFGYYPAEEIIEQFRKGKENTRNMYMHIYRQAWMLLDDTAKELLLSMLLISPDGEERDWICEVGGFSKQDFNAGSKQLKGLSLIEFSGSINTPLHRIHRLTATFLQTDILNLW